LKQTVKEWSDARARMEVEIQRKKEHQNFATNFEKARGFVRSNWKTKNFDYRDNPLVEESSEEEYDLEEDEDEESSPEEKPKDLRQGKSNM
jgi:hypothetical protein